MKRPDSGLQRLIARYKREGWREPSDQAVLAYDAVQLSGAIAFSYEGDRLPQYFLATTGRAPLAPVSRTP